MGEAFFVCLAIERREQGPALRDKEYVRRDDRGSAFAKPSPAGIYRAARPVDDEAAL